MKSSSSSAPVVPPPIHTVVSRAVEELASSGAVPPVPATTVGRVAAGPNYYSNISDYYAANATGAVRAQPKDRPAPQEDSETGGGGGGRRDMAAMAPSQPQRATPAKKSRAGPQYSTPGRSPSRLAGVNDVVSELYRSSQSRDNSKTPPRRNSTSPSASRDVATPAAGAPVVSSSSARASSSGIPMRTPPRRGTYGYNVGGSGASISSTASTVYLQALSSNNTPITPYTEAKRAKSPATPGSAAGRYASAGALSISPGSGAASTPSSSAPSRNSASPGSVSRAAAAEMRHQERIRRSKSKAEDRHFDKNTF
jgi:hypothetical protein